MAYPVFFAVVPVTPLDSERQTSQTLAGAMATSIRAATEWMAWANAVISQETNRNPRGRSAGPCAV